MHRNAPCKDCQKGYLGCQKDCKEYNDFKKQNDKEREDRKKFLQSKAYWRSNRWQ